MDPVVDTRFGLKYAIPSRSANYRGFASTILSDLPQINVNTLIVNSGATINNLTVTDSTINSTNFVSTNATISNLTGTLIQNTNFRSTNSFITNLTGTNSYLQFISIKEDGSNRRIGQVTLPATNPNTVDVTNSSVTERTRIFLTAQTGTSANKGVLFVRGRVSGTSFTIESSNIADNSTVAWFLLETN